MQKYQYINLFILELEKAEDVDASSITSKRILFTPSTELKSEIESVSFSRM